MEENEMDAIKMAKISKTSVKYRARVWKGDNITSMLRKELVCQSKFEYAKAKN